MTTIHTGNTTTTGFTVTSDSSGDLVLKTGGSGGVTAATFSGATQQATFATPVSQPGGFSFRNRLINAQGLINQRSYVSGTNTTGANQYTIDRWRVVTSGQNLTFTTSQNDTTFTAPAGGVEQVIEGLNLETGTYVLSWTGTATATVGGVSVTNGGTVSVTGGTDTTVRFSGGTFSRPQFEPGTAPTTFERRPFSTEFDLCKRYYYRLYAPASGFRFHAGISGSSTSALFSIHDVLFRSSPTVSYSNLTIVGGTVATPTALTASHGLMEGTNSYMVNLNFTLPSASTTTGFGAQLRASAIGGGLTFDAEY
jgi:hypothetical protein